MFYVFAEFDGDFGRNRISRGFATAEERAAFASTLAPAPGEGWSDYEEWEAPQSEWPHTPIGFPRGW
jgi:hypothetical protein